MLEIRVVDQVIICQDVQAAGNLVAKAIRRWANRPDGEEFITIIVKNLQYKAPPASLAINVSETTQVGEALG